MKTKKLPAEEILFFLENMGLSEEEAVFELLNAASCLTPSAETMRECVDAVLGCIESQIERNKNEG